MTESQRELWNALLNFELDDPESSFSFTDRLARENSWTLEYSLRAALEYKKFIFLIVATGQNLTPSDQVDQVWHLHLLYTHSYWKEMCGEILHCEIHHGPTKGSHQRGDFKSFYNNTLKLYPEIFKEQPPTDIWPAEEERFKYINFTRVNRHKYWVFPKIKK